MENKLSEAKNFRENLLDDETTMLEFSGVSSQKGEKFRETFGVSSQKRERNRKTVGVSSQKREQNGETFGVSSQKEIMRGDLISDTPAETTCSYEEIERAAQVLKILIKVRDRSRAEGLIDW